MVALVICCSCGRQRTVERAKRGLVCSNCGAHDPKILRKQKWWTNWEDRDGLPLHEARTRTMAGFRWICEARHYKPGWCDVQFQRMYHCRPNGEAKAAAAAPMRGVVIWIEKRNAAYGREMRRRGIKWVPRNGGKL